MSTPTPILPDALYDKDRQSLLKYEDSRFNSIINAVANYYTSLTDQTIWGSILRVIASEMARLEYDYAYDIVGKDPRFLTPPDEVRRWRAPLFISGDYPTQTQYDLDFKLMMMRLIQAYRSGATLEQMQNVIYAYTLQNNITIVELYKLIGQGFYQQSDRNTVLVTVQVGDLSTLQSLPYITKDLYGAIDLIKPAHVGVNLTTIFGENEDIAAFSEDISISDTGITDLLTITYQLIEEEPYPSQFTFAPLLNPKSPVTVLAPVDGASPPNAGVLAPRLDQVWEISGENVSILNED